MYKYVFQNQNKEKVCRKCGVELIPGKNWYSSFVKRNWYVCSECARQLDEIIRRKEGKKALAST